MLAVKSVQFWLEDQVTMLMRFSVRCLLGCTFLFHGAVGAQTHSITSNAVSWGSNDIGPIPQQATHLAGDTVSDSAAATFAVSNQLGAASGSASAESQASANFGVNRASASAGLTAYQGVEDGLFGVAYTNSAAYSFWSDTLTVAGGAVGDVVNLWFSGRTTYSLERDLGASYLPASIGLNQSFSAISNRGAGGQVNFSTADFVLHAGAGYLDWSLSFAARSGDSINLAMALSAQLTGGSFGIDRPGLTAERAAFDSTNTALLTTLDVSDGYALSSSSGALVAYEGAFAYGAVLAHGNPSPITPVPEPGTYALMVAGLGMLGIARRSRSRARRSTQTQRE